MYQLACNSIADAFSPTFRTWTLLKTKYKDLVKSYGFYNSVYASPTYASPTYASPTASPTGVVLHTNEKLSTLCWLQLHREFCSPEVCLDLVFDAEDHIRCLQLRRACRIMRCYVSCCKIKYLIRRKEIVKIYSLDSECEMLPSFMNCYLLLKSHRLLLLFKNQDYTTHIFIGAVLIGMVVFPLTICLDVVVFTALVTISFLLIPMNTCIVLCER